MLRGIHILTAVVLFSALMCAAQSGGEDDVYSTFRAPVPPTGIDKLVLSRVKKAGYQPRFFSDQVFLGGVYLDVTGTVPSADEARRFIEDKSFNKRVKLINELLNSDAYADYFAMKWCDILRVKAEFPVNLWPNAAQAYHHWVRSSIRDNKSYDKFVREMLVSNGSNFRVGPVNFYRAMQENTPEGIASSVALTFMGCRTALWEPAKLEGMAVFFSEVGYKPTREWKEEVVFWDPNKPFNTITNPALQMQEFRQRKTAVFPDGRKITLPYGEDPREIFADWLISDENPWFATIYVNRVWDWLMGRGIVHEVDDFRSDNKPSNIELLKHLRGEFIGSGYNMKKLLQYVLTSQTYHLSSVYDGDKESELESLFAFYLMRRMDAEVLIDAINKVTGSTELYTSAIPEPFTFVPSNKPAVALPDGSITSSFLEMFGKPARASGMDNERVNKLSATQRRHLLNSTHIRNKIEQGSIMNRILNGKMKQQQVIDELYLTILSRYPTTEEVAWINSYVSSGNLKPRDAGIDVAWALINSDEFMYKH